MKSINLFNLYDNNFVTIYYKLLIYNFLCMQNLIHQKALLIVHKLIIMLEKNV